MEFTKLERENNYVAINCKQMNMSLGKAKYKNIWNESG